MMIMKLAVASRVPIIVSGFHIIQVIPPRLSIEPPRVVFSSVIEPRGRPALRAL
jgi:hypothetical protein